MAARRIAVVLALVAAFGAGALTMKFWPKDDWISLNGCMIRLMRGQPSTMQAIVHDVCYEATRPVE